jgi:hypothetical protein
LRRPAKHILTTSVLAAVWIAAVAAGLRFLFQYENAPGSVGALPGLWPDSQIERAFERPTLVLVAHPRCPCTSASVGELARIMARLQGRVAAYILLVRPKNAGPEWDGTSLQRSAQAIPGVKVVFDADGADARRFGAQTSGHTLLFGADGKLLFSGGITGSRGHAGDNAGESAIVALVNNEMPARSEALVFGCALVDRAEPAPKTTCLN